MVRHVFFYISLMSFSLWAFLSYKTGKAIKKHALRRAFLSLYGGFFPIRRQNGRRVGSLSGQGAGPYFYHNKFFLKCKYKKGITLFLFPPLDDFIPLLLYLPDKRFIQLTQAISFRINQNIAHTQVNDIAPSLH